MIFHEKRLITLINNIEYEIHPRLIIYMKTFLLKQAIF